MAARIYLAAIPSKKEVLFDLDIFAFVASHLFSVGGQQSPAIAGILRLIERMEELHTKVQRIISSPHLSMTLLYNVLRRWSQNLHR